MIKQKIVQRSNKVSMYPSNRDSNACVFGKNIVAGNNTDALDKIDVGGERKIFRHEQNFDLSDGDDAFVIPGEIFDNRCKSVPSDDNIRGSKLTLTGTMMKTDMNRRINEVPEGIRGLKSKSRKRMRGGEVEASTNVRKRSLFSKRAKEVVGWKANSITPKTNQKKKRVKLKVGVIKIDDRVMHSVMGLPIGDAIFICNEDSAICDIWAEQFSGFDKSGLNWKSVLILKSGLKISELKLSELKLSEDIYQEIISGLKETFR
ncbi:hypothetical protein AgCh_020439 [Apium graveolens]